MQIKKVVKDFKQTLTDECLTDYFNYYIRKNLAIIDQILNETVFQNAITSGISFNVRFDRLSVK